MNEALRIIAILIFGNLFLIAFVLTVGALFPKRLAQTRLVAEVMPGRAFIVGLVNVLFFGAVGLAFSALADWINNELPRLPALIFIAVLAFGLSFGLAGMAQLVGARLFPQRGEIARTAWGTLSLSLGSTLPFIGWFALLPYAACLGLGAFIIGFFYRARSTEVVDKPAA